MALLVAPVGVSIVLIVLDLVLPSDRNTVILIPPLIAVVSGALLRGIPAFPPRESGGWLMVGLLLLVLFAMFLLLRGTTMTFLPFMVGLLVAIGFPLGRFILQNPFSNLLVALILSGFGLILLWTVQIPESYLPGWFQVGFWTVPMIGGGLILALQASLTTGGIVLAVGVGLLVVTGALLVGATKPKQPFGALVVLTWVGLFTYIYMTLPMNPLALILIGLTPTLPVVINLNGLARRSWSVMGLIVLLGIILLSVSFAYDQSFPRSDESMGTDGSYRPYSLELDPPREDTG